MGRYAPRGRLFDDLFYQWFVEQNPEALETMRREQAEFYVLNVYRREAKEKFSLSVALDPERTFRRPLGHYGRLSDATWQSFIARTKRYQHSSLFAHYLQQVNPLAYRQLVATNQGLDLVEWFRDSLRKGLTHWRVSDQRLACVILTGGSSAWPFVSDILKEELAHLGRRRASCKATDRMPQSRMV